jgi:phage terminase large subunit-like protein
MSLPTVELIGARDPRRLVKPPRADGTLGPDAVELARLAGLLLDPWQELTLTEGMATNGNAWAAYEVAVTVARQNGKGSALEARELFGLVVLGEQIIHTAHEFKTAKNHQRRLIDLVEGCPDIRRRVRNVIVGNEPRIEMVDGACVWFIARSRSSGRGLTGDLLVLDEAYDLPAENVGAIMPTLAASPNPQVWLTSTVPTELNAETAHLLRMRRRSLSDAPGRLVWMEWTSAQQDRPEDPPVLVDADDREAWCSANPGMGFRVPVETVEALRDAMPEAQFLSEVLGVWPADVDSASPVAESLWSACAHPGSELVGNLHLAVDVAPDRSLSSVAAAGHSSAAEVGVEVVDHRPGTSWVVERVAEIRARHRAGMVVLDPAGPAGSLVVDLEAAGVEVRLVTSREMAAACGMFLDLVGDGRLAHLDDEILNDAISALTTRPLAGAFAWGRRDGACITPAVAVTLATWAARHGDVAAAPAPVYAY